MRGQSCFAPPCDGFGVLFSRYLPRFLWAETKVVQDTPQMVGMVLHAELLANQFGQLVAQVHKSVLNPAASGPATQELESVVVFASRTAWSTAVGAAWRPKRPRHPLSKPISNVSRWSGLRQVSGQWCAEASVRGNTLQRKDGELPAPTRCLEVSYIMIRC